MLVKSETGYAFSAITDLSHGDMQLTGSDLPSATDAKGVRQAERTWCAGSATVGREWMKAMKRSGVRRMILPQKFSLILMLTRKATTSTAATIGSISGSKAF